MTGFIVNVFSFRNRVSSKEAFEGLELGEGKPSRPVLRGPGDRKAAWLLGSSSTSRRPTGSTIRLLSVLRMPDENVEIKSYEIGSIIFNFVRN